MTATLQTLPVTQLYLVESIANTGIGGQVTFYWNEGDNGVFNQNDNTEANDTLITEAFVCLSARLGTTKLEYAYLTNGTSNYLTDGIRQVTYTLTARGLPDTNTANPPSAGYARNFRSHLADALCVFNETTLVRSLAETFSAVSTNESVVAGEALDATSAALGVSLHTDNKYYKYDSATYPNLQGVIEQGNSVLADASFTLINLRGSSTNHTGLTPAGLYYVADGGVLSTTNTPTSLFLGKAKTATVLDHALQFNASAMSDAQVTAGTDTVPQLVNAKQLKDAVAEHETPPESVEIKTYLTPYPSNESFQTTTCNNTTALFSHFTLPFKMSVNHMTVATVTNAGTSGTYKIGIYSEDGQTKLSELTTNTVTNIGGATKTDLGGTLELPAGNYYAAIVGFGSASRSFASPGASSSISSLVSGERMLSARTTVSANTLPATFDPTALTASFSDNFYLRLDN